MCKTYSFSPKNVTQYSDNMITCCWQLVERSVAIMKESYGMSQHLCSQILKNRSHISYKSMAVARGVSNVVSLVKTSQKLLTRRDEIIESTRGFLVETSIKCPNPQITFTNPMAFKSLYECIMCYMNSSINWYTKPAPVQGETLETPFMYNVCETLGYMSPKLGMNMPCNILLKTGDCWTELHGDQLMELFI